MNKKNRAIKDTRAYQEWSEKRAISYIFFERTIKESLKSRGFSEETILNNRGLIGAVIEDTLVFYEELGALK